MAGQVRCADLGLHCRSTVRADNEQELVKKVADHARTKHDVELTQSLTDYAVAQAATVPGDDR